MDNRDVKAYAAKSAGAPLAPYRIKRREPGDQDIQIDITHCGICHSDLHSARDEWGVGSYPMVPGHEIAGRVSKVGPKVKKFKVGDLAGVGCLVGSCGACSNCRRGLEQFCEKGPIFTYGSTDRDGTPTYGGYSQRVVVREDFVLKIPAGAVLESTAPLLCAGITTYSPLKRFGVKKGTKVGVLGLGGLGHMAVKIAAAMGGEVTMLSGSASKRADAKRLGAQEFVLTSDSTQTAKMAGRLDCIIDTVSAEHDLGAYLSMLRVDGELLLVGGSPKPLPFLPSSLIFGRKKIAGSLIGGIGETQEMLDFCAKKKLGADVEVIGVKDINAAYERMLKGDVRYRFTIDLSTL